jgi:hypothetical protein
MATARILLRIRYACNHAESINATSVSSSQGVLEQMFLRL